MSIIDPTKCADFISNWLKDYGKKAGIKAFALGLSGGIDSALVALLAKRAGVPVVCVNLPCHSSPVAYERAAQFAKEQNLPLYKVDLGDAFASISSQFENEKRGDYDWESNLTCGALRSCLRAPTLSYLAHAIGGIILGTGNRSEDRITRYYQKFGDGCVDVSPIADLFKSEVRELFKFLATKDGMLAPGAQAIYDAKPTADLWGVDSGQEDEKELGIDYDEIEWADREDTRTSGDFLCAGYGIIFRAQDPAKNYQWFKYTTRQKQVIAKLWHLEKISRHKMNPNLPVCEVRKTEGLVR